MTKKQAGHREEPPLLELTLFSSDEAISRTKLRGIIREIATDTSVRHRPGISSLSVTSRTIGTRNDKFYIELRLFYKE
ncbi:hypothetical protein [Gracilimonas mengyeensis]|uniref:hypothetical protein n=1 Tax=Gracilimonas mengyeensis TaxID=1302730 RepID=UPI00115C29C1|nr:hypothetical protein [Gracilimonas mengyeensis]